MVWIRKLWSDLNVARRRRLSKIQVIDVDELHVYMSNECSSSSKVKIAIYPSQVRKGCIIRES
jgi:hypothetical protein